VASEPERKDVSAAAAVTVARASGVGDTAALLRQLEQLVGKGGCLSRHSTRELALKLTVDGAGKVTRVELVRGDARALACLKGRVMSLVTATKATGANGTVEVVIRL
jgi:hypothetical protein